MAIAKCVSILSLLTIVKGDHKMEPFIVGGSYAKIEDFAHAAFLAITCDRNTGTEHFSCGASVLNQVILLTAAHCLEDCLATSSMLVAVGVVNKRGPFTHEVSHFVIHPLYDGEQVANDIALAAVAEPLTLSRKVKRVVIMEDPPYQEISSVAGWGVTDVICLLVYVLRLYFYTYTTQTAISIADVINNSLGVF